MGVRVGHPALSGGEGLLRYRQCKKQLLLFPSAHPAWGNASRQEDERLLLRVTYCASSQHCVEALLLPIATGTATVT